MNAPFTTIRIQLANFATDPTFETEFAPKLRQPGAQFSYATQPNVKILYLPDESPVLRFDTRIALLDETKTSRLVCIVASEFIIHNRQLVSGGANQESITFMALLFNLAQAYTVGVLATKLQEFNLSNLKPANIVPPGYYGKDIERVLADLQSGKFRQPVTA